jgi:hypothetical protein
MRSRIAPSPPNDASVPFPTYTNPPVTSRAVPPRVKKSRPSRSVCCRPPPDTTSRVPAAERPRSGNGYHW